MAAKRRFLMLVSGYPPVKTAGMERGCQRLALALAKRGHKVTVLTQAAKDILARETGSSGVTVYRVIKPVSVGPLWGMTYMWQMRRWMKRLAGEWDFCLCHKLDLHSAVANAVAVKLGKTSAHLLVNTGAFSDIKRLREHKGGETLLRRALKASGFFTLSTQGTEELLRLKIPHERILPYRYFVDTSVYTPSPAPQPNRFLYMGRFHEQKNIPLLIRAFEIVRGDLSEAALTLVGSGPADAEVRRRVETSPARGAIRIEPWAKDPVPILQNATALILSSRSEGMSNVMIEALACGVPVITTDVSGAREALDRLNRLPAMIPAGQFAEGEGGIIVPMNDADALAAAMKSLLLSPGHRAAMAGEARRNAESRFSEDAALTLFLEGAELLVELEAQAQKR